MEAQIADSTKAAMANVATHFVSAKQDSKTPIRYGGISTTSIRFKKKEAKDYCANLYAEELLGIINAADSSYIEAVNTFVQNELGLNLSNLSNKLLDKSRFRGNPLYNYTEPHILAKIII